LSSGRRTIVAPRDALRANMQKTHSQLLNKRDLFLQPMIIRRRPVTVALQQQLRPEKKSTASIDLKIV
jgi:hypothetical protein